MKFARSALAEIGSIGRVGKVMVMLSESLKNQWGVVLPSAETNDLGVFLSLIPKPVFIVFDEIGAAFEGIGAAPDASRNSHQLGRQKDQFVSFLGEVCDILASTDGVYYLLSGRADFMRYVGLRPEVPDFVDVSRSASPGEFERISLNPIRPDHIRTIIEHTREMGSQVLLKNAIQNTYPSLSLDFIANKIYQLTGGHPRCLMMCLRRSNILDALPTAHMERLILRDVKQVIGLFPDAIRQLYVDHRNNTEINLLEMINLPEGKEASRGFLASFIHAGIGSNLTKSRLTIMPPVLEYMEAHFQPFLIFVLKVRRSPDNHQFTDKSRLFERLILAWFHSAFTNPYIPCGLIMQRFCPGDSWLRDKRWKLDSSKCKEGDLVLGRGSSAGVMSNTVSVSDFAHEIRLCLENHSFDAYLPRPKSCSPDILLIPDMGTENSCSVVIGVQAKCYNATATLSNSDTPAASLGRKDVLAEALKFQNILEEIRKESQNKPIKGVLFMCATCKYTQRDFPGIWNNVESFRWKHNSEALGDMEIVILNLSTKDLRKRFFSLGIPESVDRIEARSSSSVAWRAAVDDARSQVSDIIEDVIQLVE